MSRGLGGARREGEHDDLADAYALALAGISVAKAPDDYDPDPPGGSCAPDWTRAVTGRRAGCATLAPTRRLGELHLMARFS